MFLIAKLRLIRSDYLSMNVGVPQGSILSSLLFLVHINDLPNVSKLFSTILSGDDTTLSLTNKDYS